MLRPTSSPIHVGGLQYLLAPIAVLRTQHKTHTPAMFSPVHRLRLAVCSSTNLELRTASCAGLNLGQSCTQARQEQASLLVANKFWWARANSVSCWNYGSICEPYMAGNVDLQVPVPLQPASRAA